jgi:hypothetical protein
VKALSKPPLLNLSVEEETLAAIPFAVLERRVGKKIAKLEIQGTKILADGTEMQVAWQVQGNNELGLPTEQDLDIFVALGVLTFRNNFAKTVSFTGREIARILNISGVHGKFYRRLKMAMDRFIPLRFRALAATDRQEEVKWCNVFQEASFSLDRATGRCTGSVTWTDKLIQSMDSGFFRLLDSGRYMTLDGITAKHLYRFLAVAFEKTDLILVDARKLAVSHLGIVNPPKYFSRLMQTLEPAFEQLIQIQVLGSYHVVNGEQWRVALRRHPGYVPERKTLVLQGAVDAPEAVRERCRELLVKAGIPALAAAEYVNAAANRVEYYSLDRAAQLLEAMKQEEVLPHVAVSIIRKALDCGVASEAGRDLLDWCEIGLEVCRSKQRSRQPLRNSAGLLIKIIKDPDARQRLVAAELAQSLKRTFRQREQVMLDQAEALEERNVILEYEQFRRRLAMSLLQEMPEAARSSLRKEKAALLSQQERFARMPSEIRDLEVEELVLQEVARREAPPFEKWRLRKQVQQATLPFQELMEQAG